MTKERTVADWLAESRKFLLQHGRELLKLEPGVEQIEPAPGVIGGVTLTTDVGGPVRMGGLSMDLGQSERPDGGLQRLEDLLILNKSGEHRQARSLFLDILYDYPRWTVERALQDLVHHRVWRAVGKDKPEPEHIRGHRFWRDFVAASPADRFPLLQGAMSGRQDAILRWEQASSHDDNTGTGERYASPLHEGWDEALPLTGFKVWPMAREVVLDLRLLPHEDSADIAGFTIESNMSEAVAHAMPGLPLSRVVSHPWLNLFDTTIIHCETGNGSTHILFAGAMDMRRTTLFYREPELDALAAKFTAELETARAILLDRLSNRHLGSRWWSTHAQAPESQRHHARTHRRRTTFKNPVVRQAMASLTSAGRMPRLSRAKLLRTGGADVSAE